ncbi:MAG: hypothetical protein NTW86_30665 [Candidatus Sumerlaeota bacterium]|nr:hypothetical protein [Candidatus Sumerlaeota bacterium]
MSSLLVGAPRVFVVIMVVIAAAAIAPITTAWFECLLRGAAGAFGYFPQSGGGPGRRAPLKDSRQRLAIQPSSFAVWA